MISKGIHFIKVAYTEFKLALASEFAYRWRVLAWVLGDIVQPLLFAILWGAVASSGDREFTENDMISYYFMLAIVVKLTSDWSINFVSNSIIAGDFSKYLSRPYDYLAEMVGINIAIKAIRIFLLVPFLLVGGYLFTDSLSFDFSDGRALLFAIAILLGGVINFLTGNIFSLLAFFVKQIVGLRALYVNVVSILSGEYVPLRVLPLGAFFLFELLPFRYIISFPIEIVTDSLYYLDIRKGFAIAIAWVVILYLVYRVLFRFSIKKYESEGI